MKIAVCISGQPRNVVEGFEKYIKPNLYDLNPDIDTFIHVWWNREQVGNVFINAGDHIASVPVEEDALGTIIRLYNPMSMMIEPQIQFDTSDYVDRVWPAIKPFSSLSQKYSAMRVHQLRRMAERPSPYDAVIRLRFDYALQTPIRVEEFDLDFVNIPNRCGHVGGIDDTFAIGNEPDMNVYGDLYNNIFGLYNNARIDFCDELLLSAHLESHDVAVRTHPIQYDLIRG